jgi:hypothetical protein
MVLGYGAKLVARPRAITLHYAVMVLEPHMAVRVSINMVVFRAWGLGIRIQADGLQT